GLYSVTGDQKVTLHWIANTEDDLAGYRVYRAPAYPGPYGLLGSTQNTSWVDDTPQNGVTYWYAVAAYDDAGNEGDLSVENVHDTPRPAGVNLDLAATSSEPGSFAGYDFSANQRQLSTEVSTDIFFAVTGGVPEMVARDDSTLIQDAGYQGLDALDWAPAAGWSTTRRVTL